MNEPYTHESDDDYIDPSPATIKRGNRIAGWCAILVAILLSGYVIYDRFIKPFTQP